MSGLHRAAWPALGAAILFGASTPFVKQRMGEGFTASTSLLLAGLPYLGPSSHHRLARQSVPKSHARSPEME
jgi:hypothetical protein